MDFKKEPDVLIQVSDIIQVNNSTYKLRFEKNGISFQPGQHILLGHPDDGELREYSIYSGIDEPHIDVLIKEIINGRVSPLLRKIKVGDNILYRKPKGQFTLGNAPVGTKKFLFVATGTGIAPFHSMIVSFPKLEYFLLHGVKETVDLYDHVDYKEGRFLACTTDDPYGAYSGRVTEYLKENHVEKDRVVYLCGNFSMISEVIEILTSRGFDNDNIYTEIYF